MKTIGIIAEYNPFHFGHQYQIEEAKKITNADYAVILMSGNFVQRGTPAIADKSIRSKMALWGGADIVFELPVFFSTASAELFALGAISIFDRLNCIDYLCFGSECGDIHLLTFIAKILVEEPELYRFILKEQLKKGVTFPVAREIALLDYLASTNIVFEEFSSTYGQSTTLFEKIKSILSMPNNILSIEYIKALIKLKSNISPITITRKGAGYHSIELTKKIEFQSATAIRKLVESMYKIPLDHSKKQETLFDSTPMATAKLILSELNTSLPITVDDTSAFLGYLLLTKNKHDFSKIVDITKDLAHRMKQIKVHPLSFSKYALALKSKQYTLTRIQRLLTHLLLEITKEDMQSTIHLFLSDDIQTYRFLLENAQIDPFLSTDIHTNHSLLEHKSISTGYIKLLGFKKEASFFLRYAQDHSNIPIITKLADAKNKISTDSYLLLQKDIRASELYQLIIEQKFHTPTKNEYQQEIIIL